jgi:hypothetical protein
MRRVSIALAGLALATAGWGSTKDDEKKPVPLYTNADLERVSPYRDQTGALSTPAVAKWPEATDEAGAGKTAQKSEAYWRREAGRLRERLRRLEDQEEDLLLRIEGRRRRPGVRPYSDPQIESWERRRRLLGERRREEESRFEERARRAGALPGWLR